MGLTGRLLRLAAARPHLLLAECPGGTQARLSAERFARAKDWPLAAGPADADVLVVCGATTVELAAAVELTWEAVAGPRSRVHLTGDGAVADALERDVAELRDAPAQRADAAGRTPPDAGAEDMAEDTAGEMDHGEMDMDDPPGDMDHAEMGHGDMDMDMDMPGGLAMADRAPDRDGLRLDILHLQLGPFLPAWPAGLVVDVTLQGDVVQEAHAYGWAASTARSWWDDAAGPPGRRSAAHLDSAARVLQLAGWSAAAYTARTLRDSVLDDGSTPGTAAQVARFGAKVRQSRSLRWGLRGLGVLPAERAAQLGISGPAQRADGDVHDRLLQWLTEAWAALSGAAGRGGTRGERLGGRTASQALLEAIPGLVIGQELAGARLIVASLDPDLVDRDAAESVAKPAALHHG